MKRTRRGRSRRSRLSRTRSPKDHGLDRWTLYELCAQSPARDARLLLAIYRDQSGRISKSPRLGEDFCGTAALSRAWCEANPGGRAVAVDIDRPTLARARPHPRVRLIHADVRAVSERVDLIAVLNFSICEWHTRRDLMAYLKHARARLRTGGRLVCDLYGGSDAFLTGRTRQRVAGPRGERIMYTWEQRTADPLTGRVVNAMHFSIGASGRRAPSMHTDAFVYDWRLWSVPELREAMQEAGFTRTRVYARTAGAIDHRGELHATPIDDPWEVGDSFNVFVCAEPA